MDENWEETARYTEINWWIQKLTELKPEAFRKYREDYFMELIGMYEGKFAAKGDVLNIGMGLMSIFEFVKANRMVEVDPLIENYILAIKPETNFEAEKNTTNLKDESFDTVLCFNVIDHTSYPEKIVDEIKRVMKKDGTLFLQVNFDRYSSPAHYQVFSRGLVKKLFSDFNILFEKIRYECGPLKNWDEYYAIMVKK